MSQSTPSTGSNTASQSPMCHASYLASMLCTDAPSIVAEKESGIFSRLVEVKIGDPDLIWCSKGNEEPDNPFVPTLNSTYLLNAGKERMLNGDIDEYSLTNGQDSLLPGISACLVCDKDPSGWQSLNPGDQGPWKRDGTLYISFTQETRDKHRKIFGPGAGMGSGTVIGDGHEVTLGHAA